MDPSYFKNRIRKRRKYLENLLGGKCQDCGSTDNLQFDHIDPASKSFRISEHISKPLEELQREIDKCQLLCRNCHLKKTKDNWEYLHPPSQHGTIGHYKRFKCRCDACKNAMSDYYYNQKQQLLQTASEFYALTKIAYIGQIGNGKWRVYSESGKNLGTYNSYQAAKERLKQVEMFKHMKKKKSG